MRQRAHRPGRRAEPIGFLGGRVLISSDDTLGDYCLLEVSAPPGDSTPLHVHHEDDEGFYVLEGALELLVGDAAVLLKPRQSALAPRGVAHTWHVVSDGPARWLNISNGGLERFARDADAAGESGVMEAAERHAIEILGPPGTLPGD